MEKVSKALVNILMFSAGLMAGFAIMYGFVFLVMGITVTFPWWPIELLLGSVLAVFSAYVIDKKFKELES